MWKGFTMRRQGSKSAALQPLAVVVEHVLQQAGLGRVTWLARLQQHWKAIGGPQIAAVTHPERVRGRVLFITVNDAIWLQQLTFYHAQLLQNIRQVLGDVPITKLHFTLASSPRPFALDVETTPAPQRLPLTGEKERHVIESTVSIADTELREAVRQAWRRGWETEK
jgi:hypothetical protein